MRARETGAGDALASPSDTASDSLSFSFTPLMPEVLRPPAGTLEDIEYAAMHSSTCRTRDVSSPSGPLAGSSEPQTGHSSSSGICGTGRRGRGADTGTGGRIPGWLGSEDAAPEGNGSPRGPKVPIEWCGRCTEDALGMFCGALVAREARRCG